MGQLQYTSADEEKQIKNSLIKSFVSLEWFYPINWLISLLVIT